MVMLFRLLALTERVKFLALLGGFAVCLVVAPVQAAEPTAGKPVTQIGWTVFPDGLRQVVHHAADRTGLPLVVTENGIATEDDDERIDYLDTHLCAVVSAMQAGADVRVYLHWSAFDNFEWSEGFRPTFGLVAVERHNDFARSPKPSAHAFARVAVSGRLDALRRSATIPAGKA